METREAVTLDTRAQRRLVVLTHVLAGELDRRSAAATLGLSVRHLGRLVDRYRTDGAAALVHGRGTLNAASSGRPTLERTRMRS